MHHVVGVLNRKGGAGKTSLAVGVAGALADRLRVRLVDADPQGSAARWLRSWSAIDAVQADTETAMARAVRAPGADLVLVDGPPFDPAMNGAILALADLVVVPVRPSPLDFDAAEALLVALVGVGKRAIVVLSGTSHTVVSRQSRDALAGYGVPVAESEIGFRVAHTEAALAGQPVTAYAPGSLAAAEIRDLAREILSTLEAGHG